MADFCRQCTFEDGLPGRHPKGDLDGLTKQEDWDRGYAVCTICEGCGPIYVHPDGWCASRDCLHPHQYYPPGTEE